MSQSYRFWQTPDLEFLESSLERALMPAPPRAEFVDRLRHRLETKSKGSPNFGDEKTGQILLIALAGAVSGAILLVMGIQVIKAIINQRGVAAENHRAAPETVITIPTA